MSKITRTRRSADQWRTLIAEQAGSGLSQEAFCKDKRLALSTFANWKRRLASEPVLDNRREPDSLKWTPLSRQDLHEFKL